MINKDKIISSCYLSEEENLDYVQDITGLALDEIEMIVGRFRGNSSRAGLLRGELIETVDGDIIIRHNFTKKVLWSMND